LAAVGPTVEKPAEKTAIKPEEKPGEKEFVECNKYPPGKRFRWGVRGEVSVGELVASLGEIGCQTILVGPEVAGRAGKVSLEVPDLLTAPEVYRLFYSALEVLGLTVEREGKVLKVVLAARGREVSRPLGSGEATPESDEFVTRLIRLAHARPEEVAPILSRLRSKEGEVSSYAPTDSLVVTDRAANVRRMEELITLLDVPRGASGDRLFTVSVHAQAASELAATIEKVLSASRRSAPEAKSQAPSTQPLADGVTALVPADAARLMVVVGSEAGFRRVLALAERIDPPAADDVSGQAHVVYLANTNAEEMAQTLQSVGLGGHAPAPSRPGGGKAAGALPLEGEVRIGADKVSNAIVVFASGADFRMVRDLITKLDVPRRQVYVEATILDVTVDRSRDVGISFHNGIGPSGNGTAGVIANESSGFNTLEVNAQTLGAALSGGGLLAGVLGSSINVAGMSLPSFGVILRALEESKDVSVISQPHLLTMDNDKAKISVGQSFPYQSSTLGSPGASTSLIATYNRQDVALTLELTPHLNDSDSVRLELSGEISDVPDGQSSVSPGGPITDKRTLQTAVVVRDGETVVLGGLEKDSISESIQKIPLLGDIPVLGRLFQTRAKQHTKQDLLIILTPYVIRGPEDLRRIYQRKEAERRELVERETAFADQAAFEAHVDYRRKRGLLVEIDASARAAEKDADALRQAEKSLKHPPEDGPLSE
ncbi:MAG TPA: type II secretion system secretin GspD, partial [Polyangia bacterium]